MTREQYFEMCEALGQQPAEENIPVEYEDFDIEIQQIIQIYNILQDTWDGFNGLYLGKQLLGIEQIFKIFEIDKQDYLIIIQVIKLLDKIRSEELNRKTEKPAK